MANISVEGFEQDSLLLQQDNASVIKLVNNKLGKLRSITGISPGAHSKLEISPDNTIQEADLTVKRKGTLLVQAAKITNLKYDFGDSTNVTLSGAALGMLKK